MDKSNLELFKQALNEAISNKFDKMAAECTEEIVCTEEHKLAMRAILYGKTAGKRTCKPKMKHIIAIIVAAALLLTGCAVIFRNEICEVVDELFAKYVYSGDETGTYSLEEVYELTYLPEGYYLEKENVYNTVIKTKYVNANGNFICFEQRILDKSDFTVDIENGYSQINEVEKCAVYYRCTEKCHNYIWNNNEYVFHLTSDQKISNEEIDLILQGIK